MHVNVSKYSCKGCDTRFLLSLFFCTTTVNIKTLMVKLRQKIRTHLLEGWTFNEYGHDQSAVYYFSSFSFHEKKKKQKKVSM